MTEKPPTAIEKTWAERSTPRITWSWNFTHAMGGKCDQPFAINAKFEANHKSLPPAAGFRHETARERIGEDAIRNSLRPALGLVRALWTLRSDAQVGS